jgi:hypothetical protein
VFPETRWTLVLAARLDPEKRRLALEQLVRRCLGGSRREVRRARDSSEASRYPKG